jgi:hypothetical protein
MDMMKDYLKGLETLNNPVSVKELGTSFLQIVLLEYHT